MFCIKVGMTNEYAIAKEFAEAGTIVLSGIQTLDDLRKNVPTTCGAIMSFGMAGGLRSGLPIVGQTVIASYLVGPQGERYQCNRAWNQRLFDLTHHYVQPYYSSGLFNTANTPEQRAQIYAATGAWCIDDESLWVAQFAAERGIPFTIMRNCSDAWNDNVQITSNVLNAGGGVDPLKVLEAIVIDPEDMAKIAIHYEVSERGLRAAAQTVPPNFCWES